MRHETAQGARGCKAPHSLWKNRYRVKNIQRTYMQAKHTPHLSCLGNAETNWSRHSQTSDVCQCEHLDERWQACFHNPNHFDSKYPVSERSRWSVSGLRVAPAALRFSLGLAQKPPNQSDRRPRAWIHFYYTQTDLRTLSSSTDSEKK